MTPTCRHSFEAGGYSCTTDSRRAELTSTPKSYSTVGFISGDHGNHRIVGWWWELCIQRNEFSCRKIHGSDNLRQITVPNAGFLRVAEALESWGGYTATRHSLHVQIEAQDGTLVDPLEAGNWKLPSVLGTPNVGDTVRVSRGHYPGRTRVSWSWHGCSEFRSGCERISALDNRTSVVVPRDYQYLVVTEVFRAAPGQADDSLSSVPVLVIGRVSVETREVDPGSVDNDSFSDGSVDGELSGVPLEDFRTPGEWNDDAGSAPSLTSEFDLDVSDNVTQDTSQSAQAQAITESPYRSDTGAALGGLDVLAIKAAFDTAESEMTPTQLVVNSVGNAVEGLSLAAVDFLDVASGISRLAGQPVVDEEAEGSTSASNVASFAPTRLAVWAGGYVKGGRLANHPDDVTRDVWAGVSSAQRLWVEKMLELRYQQHPYWRPPSGDPQPPSIVQVGFLQPAVVGQHISLVYEVNGFPKPWIITEWSWCNAELTSCASLRKPASPNTRILPAHFEGMVVKATVTVVNDSGSVTTEVLSDIVQGRSAG